MTQLRQRMLEEFQRRNYSAGTIRLYLQHVAAFAQHFHLPRSTWSEGHEGNVTEVCHVDLVGHRIQRHGNRADPSRDRSSRVRVAVDYCDGAVSTGMRSRGNTIHYVNLVSQRVQRNCNRVYSHRDGSTHSLSPACCRRQKQIILLRGTSDSPASICESVGTLVLPSPVRDHYGVGGNSAGQFLASVSLWHFSRSHIPKRGEKRHCRCSVTAVV
jgi:hypothetical protein